MGRGEPIVLTGDYINYGPDSAAVLSMLRAAAQTRQVIALRGNHEALLGQFMIRPRVVIDQFLRFGGAATLESFGVTPPMPKASKSEALRARNELRDRMGDLADWVTGLPCQFQSGNLSALHAGAHPQQPIETQFQPALCWGHPLFTKELRHDDRWVIHGHRAADIVTIKDRRISINTLAGQSRSLTAVRITQGQVEVL